MNSTKSSIFPEEETARNVSENADALQMAGVNELKN
jgi:hypothetical protein